MAAIEDKERAEAKLKSAKADYEKAFEAAKARGLLPEIPGQTDTGAEKRYYVPLSSKSGIALLPIYCLL